MGVQRFPAGGMGEALQSLIQGGAGAGVEPFLHLLAGGRGPEGHLVAGGGFIDADGLDEHPLVKFQKVTW